MRILLCNSKTWFSLDSAIQDLNEVWQIARAEELTSELITEFIPDVIFFVHWNWRVPQEIYEGTESILFHTAPLPYGRGGSPIQNLISRGFSSSPVCALRMRSELDAGPIYCSTDISLSGSLSAIFGRVSDAINVLIKQILLERPVPRPQVGRPVLFKRLTDADNEIRGKLSLNELYDRVRMLDHPDYPSAYINLGELRLEFYDAELNEESLEIKCRIKKLL